MFFGNFLFAALELRREQAEALPRGVAHVPHHCGAGRCDSDALLAQPLLPGLGVPY